MRIPGVLATALAAMLLLSSCAPSATPHTRAGVPDPSPTVSIPAFLTASQQEGDRLPDGVADRLAVDDRSSRYQGDWDQHHVFLATTSTGVVCLVTGITGEPQTWVTGCGASDGIVTADLPDGGIVRYLPMVATAVPDGWTRLSDYTYAM